MADESDDVFVPSEASIALLTFRAGECGSVVESYLEAALESGFREVRIIHGKGIGVQRAAVRAILARHPAVERFVDGGPGGGEWGATRVLLNPPGSGDRPDDS
jgi:dsDNA-specific endonuclease/ATPase MutS2